MKCIYLKIMYKKTITYLLLSNKNKVYHNIYNKKNKHTAIIITIKQVIAI
ncbi:hypothetical protein BJQ96_03617 [Flavobacterium sp. PL0002]|nr:hypothetical protein [Flavobacterium sp. PL002]